MSRYHVRNRLSATRRHLVRALHHRQRGAAPGAPPGTITVDRDLPSPKICILGYGADAFFEQDIDAPEDLREHLDRWPVLWVNVDGLGDADLIARIGAVLGIHHLAIEDVAHTEQRPKVEPYDNLLYIVCRMARLGAAVDIEQVSLFLGHNIVITFQERKGDVFDPIRDRLRQKRGRIRGMGADYLAYALLDAIIDGYFPVLEEISERIERIEDEVLLRPSPDDVPYIFDLKRELLAMRRSMWPMREAINALIRQESAFIGDETRLYLRDCYDHTIQIVDMIETYRELASGIMDVYLSSISNRTNDIVKVLTMATVIFIPMNLIAAIYGMNFDTRSPWNMPELHWRFGYLFSLAAMTTVAIALLFYFRHKGWIGGRERASNSAGNSNGHPLAQPGQPGRAVENSATETRQRDFTSRGESQPPL